MAYTKTIWVNDTTPAINATNLGNIETGIDDAHTKLDGIESGAEVNNISDANATDLTDSGETSLHYHNLSNASGVLTETKGGTGESTYAQGDILYASGANNLSKLSKGTSSQVLTMNDAATLPNWENAESGFADPMTTRGDLIVRNASNVTDRMPVGTSGQVLSTDGVDFTWITAGSLEMPTGVILPYGGTSAPSGYSLCDGTAISRATYSVLFAIIGTSYGVGDGSTTFNLPDMQGNIPVGKGGSGVTNVGDTGGEQTHQLTIAEMPAHSHKSFDQFTNGTQGNYKRHQGTYTDGASTGGDGAHQNMQPYVGVTYIIRL